MIGQKDISLRLEIRNAPARAGAPLPSSPRVLDKGRFCPDSCVTSAEPAYQEVGPVAHFYSVMRKHSVVVESLNAPGAINQRKTIRSIWLMPLHVERESSIY